MMNINLLDHLSRKTIPKELLTEKLSIPRVAQWSIAKAYFLDLFLVYSTSATVCLFLNLSAETLMMTEGLDRSFAKQSPSETMLFIFPVLFLGYFFFSYFLNDGQTWGLHSSKARMSVRPHSFSDSLRWTMRSVLVYLSFGLLIPKDAFQVHDHLYHELVLEKHIFPLNLVNELDEKPETTSYQEAA